MTEIGTDWRVVDGVATAWFDAPSPIEGAALAGRIVELSAQIVVDLRATGMRVRLDSDEHAEAVSAAARGLWAGPIYTPTFLSASNGARWHAPLPRGWPRPAEQHALPRAAQLFSSFLGGELQQVLAEFPALGVVPPG